jgi:hypothetical protein
VSQVRHPCRAKALVVAFLMLPWAAGCGLRVTNDLPDHEQLDPPEKDAVATILEELSSFNEQVEQRTSYSIEALLAPKQIHVDMEGMIVAANLGDGRIHISTWEGLTEAQQQLVQRWFNLADPAEAAAAFRRFFYRFLAVSQGAKQFMYEVLTTDWVYDNRSLFSVERDSIRIALSYFKAVGEKDEMWPFVEESCRPIIDTFGVQYHDRFNKKYLLAHVQELIGNLEKPEGYMYFICRWAGMAFSAVRDLDEELAKIERLRKD